MNRNGRMALSSAVFCPAFGLSDVSRAGVAPDADGDGSCSEAVLASDFSMFFVPKFKGAMGGPLPGPSGLACAGQPGCGC